MGISHVFAGVSILILTFVCLFSRASLEDAESEVDILEAKLDKVSTDNSNTKSSENKVMFHCDSLSRLQKVTS